MKGPWRSQCSDSSQLWTQSNCFPAFFDRFQLFPREVRAHRCWCKKKEISLNMFQNKLNKNNQKSCSKINMFTISKQIHVWAPKFRTFCPTFKPPTFALRDSALERPSTICCRPSPPISRLKGSSKASHVTLKSYLLNCWPCLAYLLKRNMVKGSLGI